MSARSKALKLGIDNNGNPLYYSCERCHGINELHEKNCPHCGKKRRKDAYEQSLAMAQHKQQAESARYYVNRTAANCMPSQSRTGFSCSLPTNGDFDPETYAHNQIHGVPDYYMTDEFGRVYKARVSYGPLKNPGPVPISTPSPVVQNAPIVVSRE